MSNEYAWKERFGNWTIFLSTALLILGYIFLYGNNPKSTQDQIVSTSLQLGAMVIFALVGHFYPTFEERYRGAAAGLLLATFFNFAVTGTPTWFAVIITIVAMGVGN